MKILMVDDEIGLCECIGTLFNIQCVSNYSDLQKHNLNDFDLIILDYNFTNIVTPTELVSKIYKHNRSLVIEKWDKISLIDNLNKILVQ